MKFFLSCIFLVKMSVASCQSDLFNSATDTRNAYTLEAYDLSGNPIPTGEHAAVEGSSMLKDQFVKGVVKFKNGKQYKDVPLNLSLTSNELYFRHDSITLAFANPVDEFAFAANGKDNEKTIYFKNGYPAIGTNTDKSFYQVLSNGVKVCLLKYLYKAVQDHYEYGGPVKKEYVLRERYYVYDVINNTISEINQSSNSIKKSLHAYAEYIERFTSANKINFKKEENVISLIDFINLQPGS